MNIGVLDVQGAVAPHCEKIRSLGGQPVRVKSASDLETLAGIILPGGESTAMIHLLKLNGLWEPLKIFARERPVWGVCAGAILLAQKVTCPSQDSLGVLDMTIERNAYGRQLDSFIGVAEPTKDWGSTDTLESIFIRAPIISDTGPAVTRLLTLGGHPVLVRQGKVLASTFHPELSSSLQVHDYFINHLR